VNAYEEKAGMMYLQITVWSMPERLEIYIVYKWRYINTLFPFLFLSFLMLHTHTHTYN